MLLLNEIQPESLKDAQLNNTSSKCASKSFCQFFETYTNFYAIPLVTPTNVILVLNLFHFLNHECPTPNLGLSYV